MSLGPQVMREFGESDRKQRSLSKIEARNSKFIKYTQHTREQIIIGGSRVPEALGLESPDSECA